MKLCLDTNAYSALKRNHSEVISHIESAEVIFVPAVVLGELYAGFLMGHKFKQNQKELEEFLSLPGVEIKDSDRTIAERYGYLVKELRAIGKPIPTNDIWIAATCLETASRLLTNDSHFSFIPGLIPLPY